MVLVIDNYDSFTYNIVQYLRELGATVNVALHDQITLEEIALRRPSHIVISPGPGTPQEAGISLDVVRGLAPSTPILGVCLGHQCIGEAFGATVSHAAKVMHGKTSLIFHDGRGVYRGLPSPYRVTRYHSLVVQASTLPDAVKVTAWTTDESGEVAEIMGIRHRTLPVEGVQFHPESIASEYGHRLLGNFLSQ